MASAALVAVDWGTSSLRASLLDAEGRVLAQTRADRGVQSVAPGDFPAVLSEICRPWFAARADLPVVMAGMVGSRNGWIEAPYVPCPCGLEEIAGRMVVIDGQERDIRVVPGVDMRWPDGAYDVMRGEETQVLGCGVVDGLVCLPGTHSKWVEVEAGRIRRFATFVTGELFAAVSQSFIGRLASEPETAEPGQTTAARLARGGAGLVRNLFQARSLVLSGDLPGGAVRAFLSRSIVEAEIEAAVGLYGSPGLVHLVAAEPQAGAYRAAFEDRGIATLLVDPAVATIAGLARLTTALRIMPTGKHEEFR